MQPKNNQIISCIDIETTGLNKNADRIVQLTVTNFKMLGGGKYVILDTLNKYIKPTGYWKMNPDAQEIHNISEEFINENGVSLNSIYDKFMEMIGENPILTYNGSTFDISFIQRDFERENLTTNFDKHEFIDAYDIERKLNSNKLSDVYRRYFGKDFEDAHNSAADVQATIEVFVEQAKRYKEQTDVRIENDKNVIDESIEEISKMMQTSPEGFVYVDKNGVLKFRMGKFKEYPVADVCKENPSYIKWLFTPNNGDNVITNITKKTIKENYYKEANK